MSKKKDTRENKQIQIGWQTIQQQTKKQHTVKSHYKQTNRTNKQVLELHYKQTMDS